MQPFWEIVASNALLVVVLAAGVALLGRIWKNPVCLHLLWVFVLLKLVTPPVATVPIVLPARQALPASEARMADQRLAHPSHVDASQQEIAPITIGRELQPLANDRAVPDNPVQNLGNVPPLAEHQGIPWLTVLGWMWGMGIMLFASGHAYRILRFRKLFHSSQPPSSAVLSMAEEIAKRLGLRRSSEIRMLPVCVSPLVWSLGGRPRVFLPAALFERLDGAAQEAILAHELAHVRRKDHWVRLMEVVITTLFWWHPVVWWAARQLQELEDQCCDGMVVDMAPHGAKSYATALLDTLDFLSDRSIAAPLGATAAKSSISLTRRIAMLKNRSWTSRLTFSRLMLVLTVAALPMALAFGQKPPEATENATPVVPEKENIERHESWRVDLKLNMPDLEPQVVQFTLLNENDQDEYPVSAFMAHVKKSRESDRRRPAEADNEARKERLRAIQMEAAWDFSVFRTVAGHRVFTLTQQPCFAECESNRHGGKIGDGRRWVVTKAVEIKGKPVCWCIPIEVKPGGSVGVTLDKSNTFDLQSAYDKALAEPADDLPGSRTKPTVPITPIKQPVVERRAVNKLVKDFPEKTDLSTPESAQAAWNRASARMNDQAILELSWIKWGPREIERMKRYREANPKDTEIYNEAQRNAEILEVATYRGDFADVISKLTFPEGVGRDPYSSRSFGRINGVWKNLGEDRLPSLEAARENFDRKKDGLWQNYVKVRDGIKNGKPVSIEGEKPKRSAPIAPGEPLGISVEKADLMGRVEWAMMHGGRDITARKTIEWGDVEKDANGTRKIRYKFYATIWDKDVYTMNKVFTFDAKGNILDMEDVEGFLRKKVEKPVNISTQEGMKELVEDFFSKNFRDITSRETIEWGEVTKAENGNSSIRYKYRAKIWDKDTKIMNQVFTFDPKGTFVSVKDVEGFPQNQ